MMADEPGPAEPGPADALAVVTSHVCECGAVVEGLHGRWACTACGRVSPYLEPPQGWQAEPGYADWK
ncbi:hypothetical protein GZL_04218 [Streptomyces sp. 769]|nr:hypothetical protein GZL_04218 [Streptomyces sp. 769]